MSVDAIVQGECIRLMKAFDPSGKNAEYWEGIFKGMKSDDFTRFMEGMIKKTNPLYGVFPNYSKVKITVKNNIKLCKSMGYDLYQQVWITDPVTGLEFLTPRKYLVYPVPVSRQIQLLDDKIAVAKDNSKINPMTGQPTGHSRTARFTGPEMTILNSKGYKSTLVELMKFRGGDNDSMRIMDNTIIKEGAVSMNTVPGARERNTKSVRTLSILLTGMCFANNYASK